jgi:arylsulfatase A-like enzyme
MNRLWLGTVWLIGLAMFACRGVPEPPNIVVILIDQLRKDTADTHLSRVRALAERGVDFEQMRSASPWTYPSVVSLMTGLYPQQHNADGHPQMNVLLTFDRRLPLLPGILRARGYRTTAFVANPFLHTWNPFHEAFDSYDVGFVPSRGNRRGGQGDWSPATMFADTVNPAILRHFDGTPRTAPEFTYVHYIDVHGPWAGAPFPPGYEQATEYLDDRVMELYDYFMKRYDGDLIFIVTSDHGRALGDDERIGPETPRRMQKKSVHDFNLRIPFMILPSKRIAGPIQIKQASTNVDVVPTLLDWLGITSTVDLPGASFLPAIRGAEMPPLDRGLYAKMSAFGAGADCIVYRGRKYMREFDPSTAVVGSRAVFDLEADPRETIPLAQEFGPVDPILRDSASDRGLRYPATLEAPPEGLEEQLQALGYLRDSDDGK